MHSRRRGTNRIFSGSHHREPQAIAIRRDGLLQVLDGDNDMVEPCRDHITHRSSLNSVPATAHQYPETANGGTSERCAPPEVGTGSRPLASKVGENFLGVPLGRDLGEDMPDRAVRFDDER